MRAFGPRNSAYAFWTTTDIPTDRPTYIYHAKSRLNTPVWGSLRSPNNSFELICIAGLEKKISATLLDLHSRLVDRLFPFRYDKCCVPDYNHIQVYLHTIKHIFIRNHKSRNRNTGKRKCNLGFEAEFPVIINF